MTSPTPAPTLTLRICYFASIREALGKSEETLSIALDHAHAMTTTPTTVGDVRDRLLAKGEPYASALARGRAVRLALNHEMCEESTPLPPNEAELAFFPPVTGG